MKQEVTTQLTLIVQSGLSERHLILLCSLKLYDQTVSYQLRLCIREFFTRLVN
jgi:hypothetical protein